MVSLTLSISENLKKRMSEHSEIKWSELVRSIIQHQIEEIEEAERIVSRSRLTEKDVEDLALSVDESMAKRWKSETSN